MQALIALWSPLPLAVRVCVCAIALTLLAYIAYQAKQRTGNGDIPTIVGWIPFLGVAISYGKYGRDFLAQLSASHGPVFRLLLAGQKMIYMVNPQDFKHVFSHTDTFAFKQVEDEITVRVCEIPLSRVTVANDEFIHKLWVRHLQGRALAAGNSSMASLFVDRTVRVYSGKTEWFTVQARKWTSSLLFAVGARVVFGNSLRAEDIFDDICVLDEGFPLLIAGMPRLVVKKYYEARDRIAKEVHRQYVEDHASVGALIKERAEYFKTQGLSDHEISRINTLLVWALQANTAPVVFWCLVYVLYSPAAYRALRQEVDAACEAHGRFWENGEELSKQLDSLKGLSSAVQEAMRMCTSSASMREALTNGELQAHCPFASKKSDDAAQMQTYHVRKGERVVLLPTHHRDPRIFERPDEFQWDRFMPKADGTPREFVDANGAPLRQPVIPFGGGVSMCPGRFLATNEVRVFLLLMLRFFDAEVVPGAEIPKLDISRTAVGMLPPVNDIPIRLRWRNVTY